VTSYPSILGRVKDITKSFGGILNRQDNPSDVTNGEFVLLVILKNSSFRSSVIEN
jgi:hypothetical protein